MATGKSPIAGNFYEGKSSGLYGPRNFDAFATNVVVVAFETLGRTTQCNPEGVVGHNITYHYPAVGVGLRYVREDEKCCVTILGGASRSAETSALAVMLATGHAMKKD
ncbi:MAG: hypothetical protein ACP5NS_04435 [Candidatus Pacearchaeota archaeon]